VRALRAIERAEALLYDALISPEVLALAPKGCVRIQTGKRAGKPSMKQETINRLMLRLARRGLRVVRLKGGDPSIFGRVGEERAFLERHGVAVEVAPGITAASAAAAEFGFPLTHRGEARRLILSTARIGGGAVAESGWSGLADAEATLVFYMGGGALQEAAQRLIAEGRAAETPVMIAENVSLPSARRILTSLAALAAGEVVLAPEGPVLTVIGDVVSQAAEVTPAVEAASA
jgi:uroporphyrin-III C-methyltransferase